MSDATKHSQSLDVDLVGLYLV